MNEHVFFLLLCGSTRHQTQTEKEILLNYRNRLRVPGAFTQKSLQFAHESLSVVDEYLSQSHWPCDVCRLIRYNMQRRQEFSYFNHTRILAHTFWNIYMMIVGGNSFPGLTTKECQNTKWMETKNYNQIKLLHTRCLSGRTLQLFAIDSDTFVRCIRYIMFHRRLGLFAQFHYYRKLINIFLFALRASLTVTAASAYLNFCRINIVSLPLYVTRASAFRSCDFGSSVSAYVRIAYHNRKVAV